MVIERITLIDEALMPRKYKICFYPTIREGYFYTVGHNLFRKEFLHSKTVCFQPRKTVINLKET